VQEPGQSTHAGPGVCPFVALVGNRDRRADGPDPDNRCYAEPAPRKRDDRYQADFCYSTNFSTCSVFLAWAARNAAEPTYITEAARKAWGTGIAVPEDARDDAEAAGDDDGEGAPGTPEGGLFGAAGASDADENEPRSSDSFDWVPATAWAEAPYDERAEAEADELAAIEELEADEVEADEDDELGNDHDDEATTAPKVPAALPMRKRKRPLQPIRTRGSGEWFYADPPDRKPLVTRRYGVAPPVLLGVLGVLVAALVIFMIPTLLSSGDDGGTAVAASPSAGTTRRPAATRVPVAAATASPAPSPKTPKIRNYRVRFGDTVTGIAEKFGVRPTQLQCMNLIRNKNLIVIGDRLQIPPDGFVCPPRWRQATPAP
jgi:LysM repeat protein